MFYSAFGLVIKSKDLELNELDLIKKDTCKYDVLISKSNHNQWPILPQGNFDTECLKMSKNDFRLSIYNIAEFRVCNGNEILWEKTNQDITENDLKAFLLSSVIAALLIQRNFILLHGNGLTKNNKLIINLGRSGIGKSTISYLLMRSGWELIADDILALNKKSILLPGIPRIKLWEDTLNELNLDYSKYNQVRKNINKYIVEKENLNISRKSQEISSIYILHRENEFKDKNLIGKFTEVKNEKLRFFLIKDNIFRPRFVKGLGKEADYFLTLTKMAKNKKLFFIPLPDGIEKTERFLNQNFEDILFNN